MPAQITGDTEAILSLKTMYQNVCHAREVFPGKRVSFGGFLFRKWGLEYFGGKYLLSLHYFIISGTINRTVLAKNTFFFLS